MNHAVVGVEKEEVMRRAAHPWRRSPIKLSPIAPQPLRPHQAQGSALHLFIGDNFFLWSFAWHVDGRWPTFSETHRKHPLTFGTLQERSWCPPSIKHHLWGIKRSRTPKFWSHFFSSIEVSLAIMYECVHGRARPCLRWITW